jgi:TRAP-type C4-dicarboxylate transport system substrate-binding protein
LEIHKRFDNGKFFIREGTERGKIPKQNSNKEGGVQMEKKSFVKRTTLVGIIAFLSLMVAGSQTSGIAETKIELRIGSGHPTASDWIRLLDNFYCNEVEKRVKERTQYQLTFKRLWAGAVAKPGEELEAVEIGLLDMSLVNCGFEPTKLYLHNYACYIPFYPGDARVGARVNKKLYKKFPVLIEILNSYNQVYLASSSVANYGLLTTFPVRKTGDVKGRKICAAGPNLPWVSGVGAIPVQGTLNEAYTGLQTGVYDGWVMFPNGIVGFKLHEVCKYYAQVDFGAPSGNQLLSVNTKVWAKLPEAIKGILQEVADEFSVKEPEYMVQRQNEALKVMKETGVDIYQMSFEEKVKWANALTMNQPEKFAKEADAKGWPGTAIMKAAIKYAEEEGHKHPRKWMEE